MTIEEYVIKKYPSRFKNGVRYVKSIGNMYEIMSEGGHTLYLTREFCNQL